MRRILPLALLCLFLAPLSLRSDPPAPVPPVPVPAPTSLKIDGSTSVPPYKLVRLTAIGADPDAAVIWDVYPEDDVDFSTRADNVLEFVGPPNTYRVKLRTIKGKAVQVARATVTIGTPEPKPAPIPTPPNPGPAPAPTPAKMFLLVVEDTATAAAARGQMFADRDLAARLKEKGHEFMVKDKGVKDKDGQTPADLKPYLDRTAGRTLPQLFIVTDQGNLRFSGDLPKTAADLLALLKSVGG